MGYTNSGVFGAVRNKVGGVIFSNWKGINTIREYKVPTYSNSPDQAAQRTKFKNVVALARNLLGTLIVNFWDPFAVKMSGYNAFMQSVFPGVSSTGFIQAGALITKGTLEPLYSLIYAKYTTGSGLCEIDFSNNYFGNGLDTDNVGLVIIQKTDNRVLYYNPTIAVRSSDGALATITASLTPSDLVAFLFCHRTVDGVLVVSDSKSMLMTAP